MSDNDKEERMLMIPKGTSRLVIQFHAPDTKERLGTTYDLQVVEVKGLPLAPQHTEEEYVNLFIKWKETSIELFQASAERLALEARIKDLEDKLSRIQEATLESDADCAMAEIVGIINAE